MFGRVFRGRSAAVGLRPVRAVLLTAAVALILGSALSLAGASSADAQDTSSRYVRTCNGGKILLKNSEFQMLQLHNRERRERGIDFLCVNPDLTESSRKHAADMMRNDYFNHDSQNGRTFKDRIEATGYRNYSVIGENLSMGNGSKSTPGSQFQALMNSDGHRKNILSRSYKEIGIGSASGTYKDRSDTVIYTMNFGARNGQPHQFPSQISSSPSPAKTSLPGLYRSGTFYLKNNLSGGRADNVFEYGGTRRGTVPLMGDWNGDGKKTAGIYRSGTFFLKNQNSGGNADIRFTYGKASDRPVVGDWNGDGRDTVGIVRGGSFYLKNANRGGGADIRFSYGRASDRPVVGDWDNDGKETVGIVRGGSFYLKNANRGGGADIRFSYGRSSDEPVVGDWNNDGRDTVGIVRDGAWYLKNANEGGKADERFFYNAKGSTPIVWEN